MTLTISVLAKAALEKMVHFKDTMESERRIDDSLVLHITEKLNTFNETFTTNLFTDEETFRYIRGFLEFLTFSLQGISYHVFYIADFIVFKKFVMLMVVKADG